MNYNQLIGITFQDQQGNNIEIKLISKHAKERMQQRSYTSEQVQDVLQNAQMTYPGNKPNTVCRQKDGMRVVVSTTRGEIETFIDLSRP